MNTKICKISLFTTILACVAAMPVDAAVKTKNSNRSYSEAYQQVNAISFQQEYLDATNPTGTTASATAKLPVMVSDEKLAASILDNTSTDVTMSHLESCAMIYPNGVFKWDVPESGVRRNPNSQCVAVVELRDANSNAVLATTTIAAGDTMKCNVDSFPEKGLSYDLKYGKIEVPADAAPTIKEVEAVMNEEQKQNAGFKIAAGAIIAGVAGNMLAPKQAGDTKLFGTGKTQIIDTAVGAAAGAGIMAASTYSGKVAGDTIKSTAVNAASGMVVGNMMAGMSGGDSVISTTKCQTDTGEKDCVIGTCSTIDAEQNITNGQKDNKYYFVKKDNCKEVVECSAQIDGEYIQCSPVPASQFVRINVAAGKLCTDMKDTDYYSLNTSTFGRNPEDVTRLIEYTATSQQKGEYVPIYSASVASARQHAYAVVRLGAKPLGYTLKEWPKLAANGATEYYYRNSDGSVGHKIAENQCDFEPATRDAEDGALVDISNQARAKGTLIGTAAGGAMGGFAAYQGAQTEITERWTAAVREYEDSLSNFICITGGRYLAKYNDYLEIPELKKSE